MKEEHVEREVAEQHRQLERMFAATRHALAEAREASVIAGSFAPLREALEVHFLQEDDLYYPAIWRLRPEQKARLQACMDAHQQLRDRLREIEGHASRGELTGVLDVFDALAEEFRRHELREEAVLHDLERAIAASR
jgi:iron-sulfur cluster repair protein YtfE (RIC family)